MFNNTSHNSIMIPLINSDTASKEWLVADGACLDIVNLTHHAQLPTLLLTSTEDVLQTLTTALSGENLSTLHIIAHGRSGGILIADQWIDRNTLLNSAHLLSYWQVKRIALWSCSVGLDTEFIDVLQTLTGAEVYCTNTEISSVSLISQQLTGVNHPPLHLANILNSQQLANWSGTLSFDISGGSLNFSSSTRISGSSNTSVGAAFLYSNVITIGGQQIDAIVTFASISNGSLSTFDSTSNPYSGTTAATYLQPNFNWNSGGGSASFNIRFIEGSSYSASTNPLGTAVTLRNVLINSYDLDGTGSSGKQYTEFSAIGGYELSSTTALSYSTPSAGVSRFVPTSNAGNITSLPGTTTGDNYRVRVSYDELSEITITVGEAVSSGTAYYGLDFSTGSTFTNVVNYDLILTGSTLTTSETGTTASFTLKLTTAPTANVTVSFTGLDSTENSLSPSTLTFTTSNWNTAQTVTVTGVDDALVDGNIAYTLTASASSTDTNFNGRTALIDITNTDNDVAATAGLTLTGSPLTTSEIGTTATFTAVLTSAPSSDVTVTLTGLDNTEGSLSASSLTFTSANWNTAQTVTVTGLDDNSVDGSIAYTLTATTGSSDSLYSGANAKTGTVAITNSDNDTAGLTLTGSPLTTSETGTTATFTAVLTSAPSSDVTVTLTGLDNTEGSLSASTLTFTSANWNTAQTVTVTGLDDNSVDGSIAYTLTATTSSSDSLYSGANAKTGTVTVTNSDNDTAGLTLSASTLTTTEAGTDASFTVKLSSQPSATVTVTVTSPDSTEGTVNPTTLTFTTANWASAQTVTVTHVDDSADDGDITYAVGLASTSTDTNYQGKTGSVSVTNTDNDSAGLTLTGSPLTTSETGTTATFTAVLTSAPSSDVTVTLTGLDNTEGSLSASTLTFTSANWNTAQTVTVTGLDDNSVDGSIAYTLTATTSSSDSLYSGANAKTGTVTVTNSDNDTAGLTLSASTLTTTEAGTDASFTVKLSSQPSATVTVTVTSPDSTEGTVNPTTLTFTTANWASAQTVTVTHVDDSADDGDITYAVGLASTSTDTNYQGKTGSVSVTNTDNDSAGLTLTGSPLTTSETGTTATFTAVLTSAPSSDVTVTLTGLDNTEGSLSASTLTFTSANWNTAQTVTVTGLDDNSVDGSIAYTLTATTSSSDSLYAGANAKTGTVAITNSDNDTAGLTLSASTLTTTEAGTDARFTVKLSSQPSATVTVTVTSPDSTEGTVNPTTLTFTTANWATAQTVTVTHVDDSADDGDITYAVGLASTSTDTNYQGKTGSVSVTNTDNDSAGLTLTGSPLTTSEAGITATFTAVLTSAPSSNVTVTLTGLDNTEGSLSASTLTFTSANWNTAQTVTVTGLDDNSVDGSIAYTLTATTSSSDSLYSGANAKTGTVAITNSDNDTAGLTLSASTLTTTEAGTDASFTVKLSRRLSENTHENLAARITPSPIFMAQP